MTIEAKTHIEFRSQSNGKQAYVEVNGRIVATHLKRQDLPGDVIISTEKDIYVYVDYNYDTPLVKVVYKDKIYFMEPIAKNMFASLDDDTLVELFGSSDTDSRAVGQSFSDAHFKSSEHYKVFDTSVFDEV